MSDFRARPWSHDPNAPKIMYLLYFAEKADFAGFLIGAVLYGTPNYVRVYLAFTPFARFIVPGIVTALFFQCMGALFNPINRARGGTKLGLITYTAVMFSLATINTAINLDTQSASYVDNRGPPNVRNPLVSGPLEYQLSISTKAIHVVPTAILFFNNWLADGLLVSSVPNPAAHVFNRTAPALSMLCHLYYEPLVHGFPISDVPRLFRYVLGSLVSSQ